MPTKYDPELWEQVRERMAHLLTQGAEPREASERVSTEMHGKPAAGTIYNKYHEGWPKTRSNGRHTRPVSPAPMTRNRDHDVDDLLARVAVLEDELMRLREAKARAEGAVDVLRDVIAETGHNGHTEQ